tara:strand:+ start:492 stop:1010 length:519 start_codon:yes stop_codon:yes gene_type:complete
MFIATKDTRVTAIHELEWRCRKDAKGLSKPEYWTWLESVTTEGVPDYSGEDYEIVETDAPLSYQDKDSEGNDVTISFNQSGHIVSDLDGTHYHLKWDGSKIIKDDDALTAYQTAEKWKSIRNDRNRRLAETDYLALKDNTLSTAMKEYRNKLRSVPQDNSDPDNITWPTKPE